MPVQPSTLSAVPLFPLPDYFLMPGVVAPLHIFETRYRQMIEDLLDGPGRLVTTAYRPDSPRGESGPVTERHEVRIDLTPPVVRLFSRPVIDQRGGLFATFRDTKFTVEGEDGLSGVKSVEYAIDDEEFKPFEQPFSLPSGQHEIRCRVTDNAGNIGTQMEIEIPTGNDMSSLQIEVE